MYIMMSHGRQHRSVFYKGRTESQSQNKGVKMESLERKKDASALFLTAENASLKATASPNGL